MPHPGGEIFPALMEHGSKGRNSRSQVHLIINPYILLSGTFGAEKAGYLCSQSHFSVSAGTATMPVLYWRTGCAGRPPTSTTMRPITGSSYPPGSSAMTSQTRTAWSARAGTCTAGRQIQIWPDRVKGELQVFPGSHLRFKKIEDCLPVCGKTLDGTSLEMKS